MFENVTLVEIIGYLTVVVGLGYYGGILIGKFLDWLIEKGWI